MGNRVLEYMTDTGCAQRLKEARLRCGLSRADVADALCTYVETIWRWETGRRCPQLYFIDAMADLYGVSIDWICGRKEERS